MLKGLFLPFIWAFNGLAWLLWPFPQLVWKAMRWSWNKLFGKKGPEKTLGDAKFWDDKELREAGRLTPAGFLVGVTEKGNKFYTDPESSLMLVAQRGLGKSLTVSAHLLDLARTRQYLPDIVMYDPKRGTYHATKAALEAAGYAVRVIDIANPDLTEVRHNPMTVLRMADVYDIDRQIDAMVDLLSPKSNLHSRNEHFEDFPRIMMAGVIKYMMKVSGGKCTLQQCVHALLDDDARKTTFERMKQVRGEPLVSGAVSVWDSVSDRERGSFISSNFRKLKIWLRPSVGRITSALEGEENSIQWTWEQMFTDERPVAFFIITGLSSEDGELVRLIIGNLINSAKRFFDQTGRRLPKGLQIIIDEAKTLGTCNAVMETNRTLREAGVNLMMCWLSYEDLKTTYSDYKTLIGGCDLIGFGNSGDMDYYEVLSSRMGKTTVMTKGASKSDASEGKSEHEHERSLMKPDEIGKLGFYECVANLRSKKGLVNVRGKKPFQLNNDVVEWL